MKIKRILIELGASDIGTSKLGTLVVVIKDGKIQTSGIASEIITEDLLVSEMAKLSRNINSFKIKILGQFWGSSKIYLQHLCSSD